LAARYLEKKPRRYFDFLRARPFLFPRVNPRLTRRWIKTGAPDRKIGLIATFSRVYLKKGSTRQVNKKIADSTRNQRVFFSRYLAANDGGGLTRAPSPSTLPETKKKIV